MAKNKIKVIGYADADTVIRFREICEKRKQQKGDAVGAALKLWVNLPVELQARSLDDDIDDTSFVKMVTAIVDKRIARLTASKPRHKQSHKNLKTG
jgi:hypothetical protein